MSPTNYTVSLRPNGGWDERVLIVQCGDLVDNFIVVTERYVVLIDTLISPRTASAMLDFAGDFLTQGRQLLVINTHADYDHCWGNQLFAGTNAVYPTPIFGTRRCAERIHSGESYATLEQMQEENIEEYGDVELTAPTVLFDEHLTIDGGDLSLRLFATRGHQPDHISVLIPELGILFPGDAAEWPFPFPQSANTIPQLRASLAHMAAMSPQWVLACHAPAMLGSELMRHNIMYFDLLEQRCRDALDTGLIPKEGENIAALLQFPLVAAVPPLPDQIYSGFYLDGHLEMLRMMFEYLQQQRSN